MARARITLLTPGIVRLTLPTSQRHAARLVVANMALLSNPVLPHPGTGSFLPWARQRKRLPSSTHPWKSTPSLEVGTRHLPHLCRRRCGGCVRGVCTQPRILDSTGNRRPPGITTLCISHRICSRPHILHGHYEGGFPPRQQVQTVRDCETLIPWLHNSLLVGALLQGLYRWLAVNASWRLPRPISLAQWPRAPNHRCLLPPHRRRLLQPPLRRGLRLPLRPFPSFSPPS